ncbi:MAG: response regulator [Lachnospiraceae bacterium]|nr:response regulator [Lachnospiraceae bacterium]
MEKLDDDTCDSPVIYSLNRRVSSDVENELRELKQLIWKLIDEIPRDRNVKQKNRVKENRILWVDDYPINNETVINLLKDKNIHFDIALTTKQGVELFRSKQYDIVITDMGRGDESDAGISLIKELKHLHCQILIIVYASHAAIRKYGNEALNLGTYKVINGVGNIISDILELED